MQNENRTITSEDFTGKYTGSGLIGRVLLARFFRAVASLVKECEVRSALEVGCGAGFSTERLRAIFPAAAFEASDYYDNLVEAAQARNPGIPVTKESVCALNRADASVDCVVALEVLEHLKDPARALKELSRVTARYCIVSVPREPLWRILNLLRGAYVRAWGNTPGHLNHWSKRAFVGFVRTQFEVIAVATPLPWTVVLAKKRG